MVPIIVHVLLGTVVMEDFAVSFISIFNACTKIFLLTLKEIQWQLTCTEGQVKLATNKYITIQSQNCCLSSFMSALAVSPLFHTFRLFLYVMKHVFNLLPYSM